MSGENINFDDKKKKNQKSDFCENKNPVKIDAI